MSKVQPAQLSFLAIYNPALGPTDETFPDQLVFWYSRAAAKARAAAKKSGRKDDEKVLREEENEKLRQIGLAQGMVDFAKSFSNGQPVDSIETEKSRIVLHELEESWWALASVDLTRLPAIPQAPAESATKGSASVQTKPSFEYSSREVSPAPLLIAQLQQAHHIFSLHHGSSLDELFVRLGREKLIPALERFWSRYARTWNVLLHANPAADVFSGIQLASGGELGFGVGEEEWGSGERDVLEDLVSRTEGLVDAVVSRYGEAAKAVASDYASIPIHEALPWMGSGNQPAATDGVVFGGVGRLSRPSLRSVAMWSRQIYTNGEYAYGIQDNPLRERRKRRRRNQDHADYAEEHNDAAVAAETAHQPDVDADVVSHQNQRDDVEVADPEVRTDALDGHGHADEIKLPSDQRPQTHGRTASQDDAVKHPEQTPQTETSDRPKPAISRTAEVDSRRERATKRAEQGAATEDEAETAEGGTTWGVPDQYMKYLTLGLSEIGKPAKPKRPSATKRILESSSTTTKPVKKITNASSTKEILTVPEEDETDVASLLHMEPIPDEEPLHARFAKLRRQENRGYFLIGFKGELDELDDNGDAEVMDDKLQPDAESSRVLVRKIQVEITADRDKAAAQNESMDETLDRKAREYEPSASSAQNMQRLRVLVYVHRPFIYCFLFEDHTTSLSYPSFYQTLHKDLQPIHKPLLSSTSISRSARRLEESQADRPDEAASVRSSGSSKPSRSGTDATEPRPVFDLIYDPQLLTVRTSIPNIPEPGTPAAEGLSMGSDARQSNMPADWTRLDALNVHNQVLSTLQSSRINDLERTSRTNRGWWVVWMRIPSTATSDEDADPAPPARDYLAPEISTAPSTHMASTMAREPPNRDRIAFLVRKAANNPAAASSKASTSSRVASGMWNTLTLRPVAEASAEEKAGGEAAGWGPGALANGIGMDARKYVEGLLSLNR
ncbi:hypothetical protein LTR78_009610 [Recurvomyces mirabilis]|uniref:CCZ1/INTU/HSP4 first Longin domain-containing protein n=1 Tax=Recurvomyces mirabilis TaxID=574656 RepID=A0AAE0WFB8_9PEZI|nr:hypothetical protein LTR78_009610 [Recurvomyces mirabilis]KAK5156609.1 hypothetical protein LTS14_004821 [Recurvomyces mirabilis]